MRIKANVHTVLILLGIYVLKFSQQFYWVVIIRLSLLWEANPGTDRVHNSSEAKQLLELGLDPGLRVSVWPLTATEKVESEEGPEEEVAGQVRRRKGNCESLLSGPKKVQS